MSCNHQCSGECRFDGCNCKCGEYHEEQKEISLAKLTITDISHAMTELIKCDPFKAVYFRGKMISPTLPSPAMAY